MRIRFSLLFMAGWIFLVSTARQQEQSSMSVMMREMFIYLKSQRAKAIKNKKPEKVPLHFYRLSSTEVTAGKKLSQDHDRMEKEMLEALRSWELASVGRSAEAYQLLISRCIACHEEECPGPLIYLQGLREF